MGSPDRNLDKDYRRFWEEHIRDRPPQPTEWDPKLREQKSAGEAAGAARLPEKIGEIWNYQIGTADQSIELRVLHPERPGNPSAVVISAHGGGGLFGDVRSSESFHHQIVRKTGAIVVSCGYRLEPEVSCREAVADMLATVDWVTKGAGRTLLKTDLSKVIIEGISYGAGLAAVASFSASCPIRLGIFRAPVLDWSKTAELSWPKGITAPVFNEQRWDFYRRVRFNDVWPDDDDHVTSPLRADAITLSGQVLAHAYILVAGIDLCKNDGIRWAEILRKQNVKVELDVAEGLPHDGLELTGRVPAAAAAEDKIIHAIRQVCRDP